MMINQPPPAPKGKYLSKYIPLHKAALKGDWGAATSLSLDKETLLRAQITEGGETAMHIAAMEGRTSFVANLLDLDKEYALEVQNKKGSTALHFAAAAGNIDIAELMIERNTNLPTIGNFDGARPLYMATLTGHSDMVDILFPLSDVGVWSPEDQSVLLTTSIESGLYGLARRIVDQNKMLALVEDCNGETPLQVLARSASAFHMRTTSSDLSKKGLLSIISHKLSHLLPFKAKRETESSDDSTCDVYTLLGCIWDHMIESHQEDMIEAGQPNHMEVIGNATAKLLFIAAESENDEFIVELIRRYPDFLHKVNESRHSIFHIAVMLRHVQAFNIIYELRGSRNLILTYVDKEGNNMLHLAARLAPQSQLNLIPGAALQMQREVLWYKEIEKMVQPSYRNMKNDRGQTPHDVFISKHVKLMKEGEKQMKQTAKACMLVTMLITTVVFTSAFTVPGGFNNTGAPTLQKQKLFVVFPLAEAVATLSSLTSLLMFLSILMSRYSEDDFLSSLPFWLVIGEMSLFISIVSMMVSFCTCLMLYQHGLASIIIILVFFASVPIMYIVLKYPLMVNILRSAYDGRWLFRSHNRLLA